MRILGLGTAVPPAHLQQEVAASMAVERCCQSPQQVRLLQTLYRQSGVRQRGSVLLEPADDTRLDAFYTTCNGHTRHGPGVGERMRAYGRHAPDLAERAARAAMAEAGVTAAEVAQLIVVSCTGFSSPGVEFALIERLGLPVTVGRTSIGFMGCHGAINGLRVARALALSDPGRPVLLCAVELCSLHFQYGWNPQQIVANALFADGAAAVVGVAEQQESRRGKRAGGVSRTSPRAMPDPDASRLTVLDTRSCLIPGSAADMSWTIGDHGFEMTLSPRVPLLIEKHLRPWLAAWLGEHGLEVDAVRSWVVHPGGPRIIGATEAALGLPRGAADASRAVLAEHGNMSSPTVLFILDRLRRNGLRGPCVILAFGPGLVAEAALLGEAAA